MPQNESGAAKGAGSRDLLQPRLRLGAMRRPAQTVAGAGFRQLAARVEHDDRLAARAHEALVLEHLEHAASHLARATHEPRQLLARDFDLHPVGMRHRVRLATQVHDRVRHAPGDVDEREVAQLAIGAIEPRGELRGELEDQSRTLRGDLPEPRYVISAISLSERVRTHALRCGCS